jgi:chemotaxis signal transduction protein
MSRAFHAGYLTDEGEESTMQSGGRATYLEPIVTSADDRSADVVAETWVLFVVDEQTYALRIWEVERIVRAVEVKPLPELPPYIRGVVNVQGRVLPVVDLRVRFGQPSRPIGLEDHFIIARTPTISVVLCTDAALGSREIPGGSIPDRGAVPRCVRKLMPLDLGVVYALDLERVVFGDDSPTDSELASILEELQSA